MDDRITNTRTAADSLRMSILRFFQLGLPKEEGVSISCVIDACSPQDEEAELRCPIRFILQDGTLIRGYYIICNIGGNMYAISAAIGEHSKEFNISFPDPEAAAESKYAEKVCHFLFEELKRAAGDHFLRNPISAKP